MGSGQDRKATESNSEVMLTLETKPQVDSDADGKRRLGPLQFGRFRHENAPNHRPDETP